MFVYLLSLFALFLLSPTLCVCVCVCVCDYFPHMLSNLFHFFTRKHLLWVIYNYRVLSNPP